MSYRTEREDEFTDEQSIPFDKSANNPGDLSPDEEFKVHLARWEAPDPSRSLDLRVIDSFRREYSAPFWRRALASSIRVPLPVAATAILLVLASGFLSLRSISTSIHQEGAVQAPPRVQIVEVPVVQERTITRTVYVEKRSDSKAQKDPRRHRRYPVDVAGKGRAIEQKEEVSGQHFTHAALSGFKPVQQVRIEVIRGEKTSEN